MWALEYRVTFYAHAETRSKTVQAYTGVERQTES